MSRTAKARALVACAAAIASLAAVFGTATAAEAATPVANPVRIVHDTASNGYWELGKDGTVAALGGATNYGGVKGDSSFSGRTAVGMSAFPTGNGYWILDSKGRVYAFGASDYKGEPEGSSALSGRHVVAIASDNTGLGYRIVTNDGHVFSYGDAQNLGSPALLGNLPVAIDIEQDPKSTGFWVLSNLGYVAGQGTYTHGGIGGFAQWAAETPVSLIVDPNGGGYWILTKAGLTVPKGAAKKLGYPEGTGAFLGKSMVGGEAVNGGRGYVLLASDGSSFSYGFALTLPVVPITPIKVTP